MVYNSKLDDRFRSLLNFYLDGTDKKQKVIAISTGDFNYNGLSFSDAKSIAFEIENDDYFKVVSVPDPGDPNGVFVLEFADSWLEQIIKDEADMAYIHTLELLPQYILRICKIYDAFFSGNDNLKDDEALNTLYVSLLIKTDRLLDQPQFSEVRNQRPDLHQSFMGRVKEISSDYNAGFQKKLWHFYDAANHLAAEVHTDTGGLNPDDPSTHYFFEEIDATIEKHNNPLLDSHVPHADALQHQHTVEKRIAPEVKLHPLKPNHYIERTGKLWLSATDYADIATKGKTRRPSDNKKYEACRVMACLFKNVKSLSDGVKISKIYTVSADKIDAKKVKKVQGYVSEINEKVHEAGGPKRLIFVQAKSVQIDKSYL